MRDLKYQIYLVSRTIYLNKLHNYQFTFTEENDGFESETSGNLEESTVLQVASTNSRRRNRLGTSLRTYPMIFPPKTIILLLVTGLAAVIIGYLSLHSSNIIQILSHKNISDVGVVLQTSRIAQIVLSPAEVLDGRVESQAVSQASQINPILLSNKVSDGNAVPRSSHIDMQIREQDAQNVVIVDTKLLFNFVNFAHGAQPIKHMTSTTYKVSKWRFMMDFVDDLFGQPSYVSFLPETALQSSLESGRCWPFAGSSGFIGVALSQPIVITHIGYDHVARLFDQDPGSAPRSLSIFGILHEDNFSKVPSPYLINLSLLSKGKLKNQGVLLADIIYDIDDPSRMQTFPVIKEVLDLQLKFELVLFYINGNWGSDAFTCLYRLRVHGNV